MAIIKPFKGIKYKTDKNLDIASKIAPPYDIIDAKLQTDLYIRDPDNIVRIILGKQDPNEDNLIYERASGYYNNWIKKFPDIASVAKAEEIVLLKSWEGLGYYARCRNFHKAAKIVYENYNSILQKIQDIDKIQRTMGLGKLTPDKFHSLD